MRKKTFLIVTVVSLASILSVRTALATTALTITNPTGDGSNGTNYTLGWLFNLSSQINVSALGVYDSGADGLTQDHAVGLWDAGGNLLASTTVPASGGSLDNYFRFVPIAPLTLNPGT